MTESISIAEARDSFSEVISRVAMGHDRMVICRRGKPVAAMVPVEDVEELDRLRAGATPANLAAIAGQWEGFEEIAPWIDGAFASRQQDTGRDVSLE